MRFLPLFSGASSRQTRPKDVCGLHNPQYSLDGASLHRLGQILPLPVRFLLYLPWSRPAAQKVASDSRLVGSTIQTAVRSRRRGRPARAGRRREERRERYVARCPLTLPPRAPRSPMQRYGSDPPFWLNSRRDQGAAQRGECEPRTAGDAERRGRRGTHLQKGQPPFYGPRIPFLRSVRVMTPTVHCVN